jgi:hypothetical protein
MVLGLGAVEWFLVPIFPPSASIGRDCQGGREHHGELE